MLGVYLGIEKVDLAERRPEEDRDTDGHSTSRPFVRPGVVLAQWLREPLDPNWDPE